MPTYNILGLQIFIPDLNDLINAVVTPLTQTIMNTLSGLAGALNVVVAPLETFIVQVRDFIVNAIVSAFDSLLALPSVLETFFFTTFPNALNSLASTILNALTRVANAVAGLPSLIDGVATTVYTSLTSFVSSVVGQITNALASATSYLWSTFIKPALDALSAFISNSLSTLITLGNTILSGVNGLFNQLTVSFNSLGADISGRLANTEHVLGNVSESVNVAFNQLITGINSIAAGFTQGLNTLGATLWQAFLDYIVKPAQAVVTTFESALTGTLANVQANIRNAILQFLPRSPQAAFDSALGIAEIGLVTFATGEIATLTLEALYPTKHLGLPEAFHKGIDFLGITEVSAALYGVIVESGWSTQLQNYFNYQLQPRRIDEQTALTSVYYGTKSLAQYQDDLRWNGFNDSAIADKTATAFQPINARILVSLVEDNLVDDAFVLDQLRQQGFDPSQVGNILKALQYRTLKPFEVTAKSIVFTMFKDGLLDQSTASNILSAFGTPKPQQDYIFLLGRYQFSYEQKLLIRTYYIDLVKKAQLAPADAIDNITALGFGRDRASVLVQIALATSLPALTKAQRTDLLTALTTVLSGT
jgi:hypothetical protein